MSNADLPEGNIALHFLNYVTGPASDGARGGDSAGAFASAD